MYHVVLQKSFFWVRANECYLQYTNYPEAALADSRKFAYLTVYVQYLCTSVVQSSPQQSLGPRQCLPSLRHRNDTGLDQINGQPGEHAVTPFSSQDIYSNRHHFLVIRDVRVERSLAHCSTFSVYFRHARQRVNLHGNTKSGTSA
jgi:hypothetical protein